MKLLALEKEALDKWKEADDIYKMILEKDPTNSYAMKRQITIRKAKRDLTEAVKLLNEYLKLFMADVDAWMELAALHIELNSYKSAAFCYEEVILAHPQNYHYHTKYAEVLYTIGGYDNYKLARKYFAASYELNQESNARALYGLIAVLHSAQLLLTLLCTKSTTAIQNTKQGRNDKENVALFEFAFNKLQQLYKESPTLLPLLNAFVASKDNNKNSKEEK